MPAAWHRLAAPSLAAHRALAAHLSAVLDDGPTWQWPGRLSVATDNQSEKYVRERLREDVAAGDAGEWLDKQAIHAREPALGGRVQGGSFKPGQGWVDGAALTRALVAAATRYGAVVHEAHPVDTLLWQGSRVVGATAGRATFRAAATVIAAGLGSATIDETLSAPLHAVRGQALYLPLPNDAPALRHFVSGVGIYMVPEGNGVSMGSTHEHVAQRGNTAAGIAKLLSNGLTLIPALGKADWSQAQFAANGEKGQFPGARYQVSERGRV